MPFVTGLYAGLVALLLLVLALRVSRFRTRTQVGIGDDGDPAFRRGDKRARQRAGMVVLALHDIVAFVRVAAAA
jgi:uncharacterized membrane protein YecN with MAPEG domain